MRNSLLITDIKIEEDFRAAPYKDATGTPTIGYGSTMYENGVKVTLNDSPITRERAEEILISWAEKFAFDVDRLVSSPINENQRDALISFVYNVGSYQFEESTLLKLINKNPDNPAIYDEFQKWVYSKGVKLNGLIARRKREAAKYFKKKILA